MKKLKFTLVIFALIVTAFVTMFAYYQITNPCRDLKKIQNNSELSGKLRQQLMMYVNNEQVRSELDGKVGRMFSLYDFKYSYEPYLSDFNVFSRNLHLIIKSDREDQTFIEPYKIVEVGIYNARSSLIYSNITNTSALKNNFDTVLAEKASLVCGVQ